MIATLLCGCADGMLLYPSRQPIRETKSVRLQIASPTGSLEIRTMRSRGAASEQPAAYVLAFIGNASRAEWDSEQVAEQWGDRPVEVWAVNYPGYGQSEGAARLCSIGPAALAAFDALKKHAGDRPIFVYGRSIGTTAALHVASHRNVDGVILHSPPPLRSLIMGEFGWWNLWIAAGIVCSGLPGDLDSIANARHVKAPGIFIITGGDRLVPPAYQQKVVDAYAGPKQVLFMPGVGHNDPIPAEQLPELHTAFDLLLRQNE